MRLIWLLSVLLGIFNLNAQIQDANLWTSIGLNADLTKKISLGYETQTRFYKNATVLDAYYNELGITYKLNKSVRFSADYRFVWKNRESYFEGVNRICLNASYDYRFKDLGLRVKARVRYQTRFSRINAANGNEYLDPDTKNVVRFKVGIKYKNKDFKLIQPFASYEFYKATYSKLEGYPVDSYRISGGLSFDLPKRHSFDLYYIYEREHRNNPRINHMYCIQYNYDIFKKPYFSQKKKVESNSKQLKN